MTHIVEPLLDEYKAKLVLSSPVPPLRTCRVTVKDLDGVAHHVEVQASTLFEAGAAAIAAFRQQGWAADALTPTATLHIEVELPPIAHDVPLKAIERWLSKPSVSPKEEMGKRTLRSRQPSHESRPDRQSIPDRQGG